MAAQNVQEGQGKPLKTAQRAKTDLLGMPFLGFLFKNPTFLLCLRSAIVALMAYAIVYGFLVPGSENIFTTGLFWGIFWPFFMLVSLATLGRIFCGICPHAFLGKTLTHYGLKRSLPRFLKTPYIGIFLLIMGWWVTFYIDESIFKTPLATAVFFTVFTVIALICFFIWRDMAYCKSLCPVGTITRAFAKVSFTWLGTYQEKCKICREFDCATSCSYGLKPYSFDRKQTMGDCTLCMDCASACENVSFKLKTPSFSLFKMFKPSGPEVWSYLLIISAISIAMVYHHALGRTAIAMHFPWSKTAMLLNDFFAENGVDLTGLVAFFYAIATVLFFALMGMFIASKILGSKFIPTFYTLGYAFAPLFIIGGLSHLWETFFLETYSTIFNAFIQGTRLSIDTVSPLATREATWLRVFSIFNYAAVIWAFAILIKRLKFFSDRRLTRLLAFPFAAALIIFFLWLNVYVIYVFATYGAASQSGHQHSSPAAQQFQSVPAHQAVLLQKGENRMFCNTCRMSLPPFYKTNHALKLKNGEVRQYCSLYCLVDMLHRHQSNNTPLVPDEILVVDAENLTFTNAKTAFYVIGSRIRGTMSSKSKYAFADKEDANAFVEKQGGQIVNFAEALKTAEEDF